jgi:pimeloyl-ACP methyl ester carboxylesterase
MTTKDLTTDDGIRIVYDVVGEGAPIVLVHGFASSRAQNWKQPGWYETLGAAGYRVIAADCRGHGDSDKPYDPAFYPHARMAKDVLSVMDAEGVSAAPLMGYSMGGMISMHLLLDQPSRFPRVVIGGVGASYLHGGETSMVSAERRARIVAALRTDDRSTIADPEAKGFRAFADQAGKDRLALAACMSADRHIFTRDELGHAGMPVLFVCGEKDASTADPDGLASAFPRGRAVTVPNRDHMTTVGDKVYKQAVLEFLQE